MSEWTPDMANARHPIGTIVYVRCRVQQHDGEGRAYIQPITAAGNPLQPEGSFCLPEEWLIAGPRLVEAIRRGMRKATRRGRVEL